MFCIFARSRLTAPLWLLSLSIVLLGATFADFSTTSVLGVAYLLSGKVTNQSGTAIAGVTIDVIHPATAVTVGTTMTTAYGTYALSVESGTYDIRVTPPAGSHFAPSVSPNRSVTANTIIDFVLVPLAPAPVTLSGRVTDGNGQGLAGIELSLYGDKSFRHTTDASGAYRFEVPPGQYHLATRGSRQLNQPASYTLDTESRLTLTQSMTLDLTLPFKRVTVHVQDAQGNPVAHAQVQTDRSFVELPWGNVLARGFSEYSGSRAVFTDAAGNAVLWLFPTFTHEGYTVMVDPPPAPAGASVAVTRVSNIVVTADRAVTVTLPPAVPQVVLSGRVTDGNGQGLAGIELSLYGDKSFRHTTDASGAYRFEVPPGQYHLATRGSRQLNQPASYTLDTESRLTLTQSMTLDLTLPFKRVTVHVQDAQGNPVAHAQVQTDRSFVELPWGNVLARGFSEYSGSRAVFTDAAGNAVLWLFPTFTREGYTFTVTPPAGTPFAVFRMPNITLTEDRSEIIVLQYDHAPPITTATITPAPNANGIYTGPVTVSLTATATSGYTVAATYYTVDNGPRQTYTGQFTVSGAGPHTVTYWSIDTMGVTETTKVLKLNM